MGEERSNKIETAIKQHSMPLFEVWCEKANLEPIERAILYLKEFDPRHLNETEQMLELQEDFPYYFELRTYQNHWRKLKKKIFRILP